MNGVATPLNSTLTAPVNPEPLIVTVDPGSADAGLNASILGATLNAFALCTVPPGVVTAIVPVSAPFGTVAVMFVSLFTMNAALTPANVSAVAPVKCVPVTVTRPPTTDFFGEKLWIVGSVGAATMAIMYDALPASPRASVALTPNMNAPTVVGVPASVPSPESVRPAGTAPLVPLKRNGAVPPIAPSICM